MIVQCGAPRLVDPFDYSWPQGVEHFARVWRVPVRVDEVTQIEVAHGLAPREVYGRVREHSVTFVNGEPRAEGVAADDFDKTGLLLSRVKRADNKTARSVGEVPAGLEGFQLVDHRAAIAAKFSPRCLAVAIRFDDATSWARFAVHRTRLLGRL